MGVPTKARRQKIYLFKNLQEVKGKNAQVAVEFFDDDEGEEVEAEAIGPLFGSNLRWRK
jgi:hypothetical protein